MDKKQVFNEGMAALVALYKEIARLEKAKAEYEEAAEETREATLDKAEELFNQLEEVKKALPEAWQHTGINTLALVRSCVADLQSDVESWRRVVERQRAELDFKARAAERNASKYRDVRAKYQSLRDMLANEVYIEEVPMEPLTDEDLVASVVSRDEYERLSAQLDDITDELEETREELRQVRAENLELESEVGSLKNTAWFEKDRVNRLRETLFSSFNEERRDEWIKEMSLARGWGDAALLFAEKTSLLWLDASYIAKMLKDNDLL